MAFTASTLSPLVEPGRDLRYFPVSQPSVSTNGDYRVNTIFDSNVLDIDVKNLSFDSYDSLNTLKITGSTSSSTINVFVQPQELKLDFQRPTSNSYFGGFEKEITKAIAEIIKTFPYAVYVTSATSTTTTANTIYDYSFSADLTTNQVVSNFKVPFANVINQGNVFLNSGSSTDGKSLFLNFKDYVIQFKGSSTATTVNRFPILNYSFSAGSHLEFSVQGQLLSGQTSGSTNEEIYIAPSPKDMYLFNKDLTPLQNQVLNNGNYKIANPLLDDGTTIEVSWVWPRTIDGFNPDRFGTQYTNFVSGVTKLAEKLDCDKTNMMVQTMIPDAYFDFDSEDDIYATAIQAHGHEFDVIKKYIDGLVFAHTVTYDGSENVPDKFIFKLAKLLGWELSPQFSEVDLMEYLSGDVDESDNTGQYYNTEVFRRILTNIIWLFKRKGTREALMFIFRLIGAPDCMIRFDEIVYDIQSAAASGSTNTLLEDSLSPKVKTNGFPDYDANPDIFHAGGRGRGNGRRYIDFWRPEFDPMRRVDNVKTQSGDSQFFGSENILNSKEVCVALDPAQAIECDMHEWYQSAGTLFNYEDTTTSACTWDFPFQWIPNNPEAVRPTGATNHISGMTYSEYWDYLFKTLVDVTNRKTNASGHTSFWYPELKNVYLNYMYLSNPISNRITMSKLEHFVGLIERKFFNYGRQLIPATTILMCQGVLYRNGQFHRERFVYKEGIDRGSEFRVDPSQPEDERDLVEVTSEVVLPTESEIVVLEVTSEIINEIDPVICPYKVEGEIIVSTTSQVFGYDIRAEIDGGNEVNDEVVNEVSADNLLDQLSDIV